MALTKHDTSRPTVLLSGGAERIKAKISEDNASHIIERLTKLYKDPLAAMIRETCSNAIDATVALPESQCAPIEITSPSAFTPVVEIRDHAAGMSLETIRNVYVNYGASTKGDDLSAVGSHGLGGKSPLAYTNHFNVETTHEGVTTSFTMQRSGAGDVETVINFSKETGAPSGTVVKIPISSIDVDRANKVIDVYRNFSWNTPVIIDGELFSGTALYEPFGTVVLYRDNDVEIKGTVHVQRSQLAQFFKHVNSQEIFDREMSYVLAGWLYPASGSPHDFENNEMPTYIVDLVPALVEFSSSRDSITKNERLQLVNKNVTDSVISQSNFIEDAFRIFRSLDREDVAMFDRYIPSNVIDFENGVVNVRHKWQTSPIFSGPLSLFESKDGYNIALANSFEGTTHISFGLGLKNGEILNYVRASSQDNLFGKTLISDVVARIGALTENFLEPSQSLISCALAFFKSSFKMTLVTDVDLATYKRLIRNRFAMFDARENIEEVLFFTGKSSSRLNQKEVKLTKQLLGDRFQIVPVGELEKQMVPHIKRRREERAAQKNDANLDEILSETLSYMTPVSPEQTNEAYLARSSVYHYPGSLRDMLRDDDSVIFIGNDWRYILIGALNEGHDFNGKTIYIFSQMLRAPLAKAVLPYKNRFFFGSNMNVRHKAGEELAVNRRFHGTVLLSALAELSDDYLLARISRDALANLDPRTLEIVREALPVTSTEHRIFDSVIRLNNGEFPESTISSIFAKQEWVTRHGEDEHIEKMAEILNVINSISALDNRDAALIRTALNTSHMNAPIRENSAFTRMIIKDFAERLMNGSLYAENSV